MTSRRRTGGAHGGHETAEVRDVWRTVMGGSKGGIAQTSGLVLVRSL